MRFHLNTGQKITILLACCILAFIGFMLKLPSAFRSIDKELHSLFYFFAAAFLNILFSVKNLLKHAALFAALYFFGIAIEHLQAYSNKFFHKRIHGRFDPEDVQSNLNGLIAFSIIWLIGVGVFFVYKKATSKGYENGR